MSVLFSEKSTASLSCTQLDKVQFHGLPSEMTYKSKGEFNVAILVS